MRLVEVLRDGRVKVGGDAGKFRRHVAIVPLDDAAAQGRRRVGALQNRAFSAVEGGLPRLCDGRAPAAFGIPRNSVSQIKTRVERLVAAIEAEF